MKRLNLDKMIINKNNYELYAIDYLEGTLDVSTQKAMDQFLTQNPTIQSELDEMQEYVLVADKTIVFENKAALKQPVGIGIGIIGWKVWGTTIGIFLMITLGLLYTQKQTNTYPKQVVKQQQIIEKSANSTITAKKEGTVKLSSPKIPSTKILEAKGTVISPAKTSETVKSAVNNIEKTTNNKTFNVTATTDLEQEKEAVVPTKTQKPKQITEPTSVKPSKKATTKKKVKQVKKKIYNMPMATIDNRVIEIQTLTKATDISTIDHAVTVGLALNQDSQNTNTQGKSIKTPFGKINLGGIKEAFVPETYIASK